MTGLCGNYFLVQDNNSPKFERVQAREEMKVHLTGTPGMNRAPRRKFGTVLQPSLLSVESPVPMTRGRLVHSSTPVRGKETAPPMVEATPICAPKPVETPLSPSPEMVTGGLAKLCAIM